MNRFERSDTLDIVLYKNIPLLLCVFFEITNARNLNFLYICVCVATATLELFFCVDVVRVFRWHKKNVKQVESLFFVDRQKN